MSARRGAGERGVALVHVLMMSVLLVMLATSLLKTMFAGHMISAKVQSSTSAKYWVEACMLQKMQQWQGNPCFGGSSDSCTISGNAVSVTCTNEFDSTAGYNRVRVTYTVTAP